MGLLHVMHSKDEVAIDWIPTDYVNNVVIAAAWETATQYRITEVPKIYNVCSTRNRRFWSK